LLRQNQCIKEYSMSNHSIFLRVSLAVIVAVPGLGLVSLAKAQDSADVSPQSFATQAATIGKAEIELGQLATRNSSDANVKKFAARMVQDHTAADAKLKGIAAKDNLTLPTQLDAEHQATKAKLSALKGPEFDAAYSEAMAKGHDKAVALFESASQDASFPPDLKQFASSTLPTLKEHQKMAHSLHGKEAS
jgi:putative membrane protein